MATERLVVRRRIVTEEVPLAATIRREKLVIQHCALPPEESAGTAPVASAPVVPALREELPVITLVTRPYEQVTISVVQVAGKQEMPPR
jgi:hypothetical protein